MGKRGPVSTRAKRTKSKAVAVSATYFPVERGMSDAAKRIWRAVVKSMPEGYFSEADRPQLRGYCESSAMLEKATQAITDNGATYSDHNGNPKESPWINIYHKALAAVNSAGTKLRISKSTQILPKAAGRAAYDAAEAMGAGDGFGDLLFSGEHQARQ